jgi:hypothetical protein
MAKRKYTKNGEKPKAYECTKKKCKWQGTPEQVGKQYLSNGITQSICPKCCNNEFYGLLEIPTNN